MFATARRLAPTRAADERLAPPKPVIAMVHGWCVGGGSDFSLSADMVVASDDAVIRHPYSRCGAATCPDCGSTGSALPRPRVTR